MPTLRKLLLPVAASAIALIVLTLILIRENDNSSREKTPSLSIPTPPTALAALREPRAPSETITPPTPAPAQSVPQQAAEVAPGGGLEPAEPADDPEPVHWYNGMDPESQPRSFHRVSFAHRQTYPEGFLITGDDVRLTDAGWTLAPPKQGEEALPRSGMIESPVIPTDFPSNAITPFWKEVSPDGTEILIELAASPDGEHWTSWFPTTGAHMDGEILQFNEVTGEPNPNYGYTLGDMVFFGVRQFRYYKYTMLLYSETADSPVLSDFTIYQQDSTLGDGHLVEYKPELDLSKEGG